MIKKIIPFLFLLVILPVYCLAADISVVSGTSNVLAFSDISQVAIANPEIADVVIVSASEVLIVGKAEGETTLHIWTSSGRESFAVFVLPNNSQVEEIAKSINTKTVTVSKAGKNILLEGSVETAAQKKRAEQLAKAVNENVVNLLSITNEKQIKIEAKIIEIKKEETKNLGIMWGNDVMTPGSFMFGQSQTNNIAANTLGHLGTYAQINAQLDALVKEGSAKILSQPNIITTSAEKANIMVGGQIPIPVSNTNGQVTVEWKDYGIKLDIEPASEENVIKTKVKAEVSSLDWNSAHKIQISGNASIPPLTMRKAESVLSVKPGQTIAIGGLLSRETSQDVYKVPLLGDLPIIGSLFKSSSFTKGQTELVILITPNIIEGENHGEN